MHGSLSYCTIIQLEQYCQWLDRWDETCYVDAFMSLHDKVSSGTEKHLMVQRRDEASKPLLDSKAQGERENEEINLINDLSPGDSGWLQEDLPFHHTLH